MDNEANYFSIFIAIVAVVYSLISIMKGRPRPAQDEDDEEIEEVRAPVAKRQAPPAAPIEQQAAPQYEFHSNIEERHDLPEVRKVKKGNIQELIKSLPQEKLLFISYEVFSKPVGSRPTPFPWNG